MLYIRADGNAEIGTGHIMRCLSIAKAAVTLGEECIFITADKNMESLLVEQGFHIICLDSIWNDLNCETDKLSSLIIERKIEKLLIDSYFVTPEYLQRLYELTCVIYIDDINAFHYPCHMLINYNINADKFDYPSNYPHAKLLLGPKYAPLREEFQNLPKRVIKKEVEAILVTTGGSDPYNLAGNLVEKAKQNNRLEHLEFHIVAGRFNSNLPMLEHLAEKYSGVVIHRNVQKMSELMLSCDIAVSAGGSTTYELCACGTPTVVFVWADNQLGIAKSFHEANGMLYAGDVRNNEFTCIKNILDYLLMLSGDLHQRDELADKARNIVACNGAMQIAEKLMFQL